MQKRKIFTVLLALVLAVSMGVTPVYAADGDPAAVKDTYEIDGVTYVNVGNKDFSTNQTAYYKAMLGNALNSKNNTVGGSMGKYSISDLWAQLAWNMERYNDNSNHNDDLLKRWNRLYEPETVDNPTTWVPAQQQIMDFLFAPDTGQNEYKTVQFRWGDQVFNPLWFRDTLRSAANSTAMAEAVTRTAAEMERNGLGRNVTVKDVRIDDPPEESGLVFYKTLGTASNYYTGGAGFDLYGDKHHCHMIVVAFSDFTVTPIIPEGNDTAPYVYVTSTNKSSSSVKRKIVSDVKNATTEPVSASQSISETISSTLTSSISGSSSYSESDSHKVGVKFSGDSFLGIGPKWELSYEYNKIMTDTVTKGWSKDESVTDTDSKSSDISVTLPPYTAIMLSQQHSTEELVSRYNCPVALNYKATVYYVYEDTRSDYACVHFKKIAEFGAEESGKPALEDLADRFDDYKVANTADKELIRWKDMSNHCADAISIVSTTAPFDSTNAKFTEATEMVKSQVDSILPLKPIKYIKPVNVNDGSALTNQQWDYDIDMNEGDSDYTSRIRLKALNDQGVEFAGFNQALGHFIVTDEDGNEDTSGSVVELVKDKASGLTKYVARREGIAYLKYIIDEDAYQTADMAANTPDKYLTNDDIDRLGNTAVIQINVHHKHNLVRHAAVRATDTKDGNFLYWSCSDGDNPCGKCFSDKNGENEISEEETVDPATGYNWNSGGGLLGQNPSATKEDAVEDSGKNSGEVENKTIAKLGTADLYAKVSSDKTRQRISWTKVKGADGYSVYFTPCSDNETVGNFDLVKNVNNKTFSFIKKGLKKGKAYKSYVEAFKNVNGKKVVIAKSLPVYSITGNYNSKYTNPKKVTTGKTKVSIKVGKKYKVKGNKIKKYKSNRKVMNHGALYRYKSSDINIATVSSKGVIKGKSKGTCKVHVIANNGVEAIIKVTIK